MKLSRYRPLVIASTSTMNLSTFITLADPAPKINLECYEEVEYPRNSYLSYLADYAAAIKSARARSQASLKRTSDLTVFEPESSPKAEKKAKMDPSLAFNEPVPEYLMKIFHGICTKMVITRSFVRSISASVYFKDAMVLMSCSDITGYVSSNARRMYEDQGGNFFQWRDTPNGPCFSVSADAFQSDEGRRAKLELNILLRLHGAYLR